MKFMQAFFKPQAKSLRYMALPHWQDAVEDALTLYARRKAHSFAPTLAQVHKQHLSQARHARCCDTVMSATGPHQSCSAITHSWAVMS